MASVHDYLYRSDTFTDIVLSDYITQLTNHLRNEYADPSRQFEVHLTCDEIRLELEKAITLGLILNELITNSFKYAHRDDGQLVLDITIVKSNEHTVSMSVRDNGDTAGVTRSPGSSSSGFGWQLVQILAESDLDGEWSVSTDHGTHHRITFKILG